MRLTVRLTVAYALLVPAVLTSDTFLAGSPAAATASEQLVITVLNLTDMWPQAAPPDGDIVEVGLEQLQRRSVLSEATIREIRASHSGGGLARSTLLRVVAELTLDPQLLVRFDARRLERELRRVFPSVSLPPGDAFGNIDAQDIRRVFRVIAIAPGKPTLAVQRWSYGRIVGPVSAEQAGR